MSAIRSAFLRGVSFIPVVAFSTAFGDDCRPLAYPDPISPLGLPASANFGAAVAGAGTLLFVGAPLANSGKGEVHAYRFENGSWIASGIIQANDGQAGDHFGSAVSTFNGVLVVGAPDHDAAGADAGAAYVFLQAGIGNWVQQAKRIGADSVAGDRFGAAVATTGFRFVVGAPGADGLFPNQGAAYVFEGTSAQYSEWKLTDSSLQSNEAFGSSVDLFLDRVYVGAPGYDETSFLAQDAGRVFAFHDIQILSATFFVKTQILQASDPVPFCGFGRSLDVANYRLLVGAPGAAGNGVPKAGAGYVFTIGGFDPALGFDQKLVASTPITNGALGTGAALSDSSEVFLSGPSRVHRFAETAGGVWTDRGPLEAPFADLLVDAPVVLGPRIAAANDALIVARESAGAKPGFAVIFHLCGGKWTVLGEGSPGTAGQPRLRGAGPLVAGTPLKLRIEYGRPNAASLLLIRYGAPNVAGFYGGILYVLPWGLALGYPLSPSGNLALPATMPAGLAGLDFVLQSIVVDPQAQGGVALTNGLVVLTAP